MRCTLDGMRYYQNQLPLFNHWLYYAKYIFNHAHIKAYLSVNSVNAMALTEQTRKQTTDTYAMFTNSEERPIQMQQNNLNSFLNALRDEVTQLLVLQHNV